MSEEGKTRIRTNRKSLPADERIKVENIESVIGIVNIIREALQEHRQLALIGARVKMGISDKDTPEGYTRDVGYDSKTAELVIVDTPKAVVEEESVIGKRADSDKKDLEKKVN